MPYFCPQLKLFLVFAYFFIEIEARRRCYNSLNQRPIDLIKAARSAIKDYVLAKVNRLRLYCLTRSAILLSAKTVLVVFAYRQLGLVINKEVNKQVDVKIAPYN